MNTSARTILSTVSGLALVACTAIAVTTAGVASTSAVLAISGLVIWALAQMIVIDLTSGAFSSSASVQTSVRTVHTPAVISYPRVQSAGLHAA